MAKKVLILSGSPRVKGNSDLLCDEFLRGVKDAGNDGEIMRIASKKIGFCTGCETCAKTKKCFQQDDMYEILLKMSKAQVIVLATPVYFYSMDGQMKTLIDRTLPIYTELKDKEFYIILTAAETNKEIMQPTVDGFRGFFDCLENPKEKGILYGLGVWKKGEVKETALMEEAYKMGSKV
jgi:multimeric flavodoxin WrbA